MIYWKVLIIDVVYIKHKKSYDQKMVGNLSIT